ncbi:hypothetical protein LIER_29894 [Lithospermum erythrorhizon]|uniref:Reverse transcriptase domain-containing protein n=1 Tax=Lithospermum erythrorhizon TaxID=34254 RepID=A0AAV3RP05_LITER
MCTDFTNVNKVCPKDCYPLPKGFFGRLPGINHQIFMAEEDLENTVFITEYGIYYWKVMAFDLNNVGATYQQMVNKVFSIQIGRNMKICVDDMLIKNRGAQEHDINLRESFENLRKYNLRLNLDKCMFGITSSKFLGYMIS